MLPLKINLLGLTRTQLQRMMVDRGFKPYNGDQLFSWIHQLGKAEIEQMSNLSKSLRKTLLDHYVIVAPKIIKEHQAQDGTIKWLVEVESGSIVETIFIPQGKRATLCISSQAGCTLNCDFCHTGKQGFERNLSSAEIIGQLWLANSRLNTKVTNVVMMGMGEPLLNCPAVFGALNMMRDQLGYALPRRRVTVSTSGVVPAIYQLADYTDVSLAISLHAPEDKLRNILVPLNKKYPIKVLMEACRYFLQTQQHRNPFITIEYVMLHEVNDSVAHANDLAKLLKQEKIACKINLIPFNFFPGTKYHASNPTNLKIFSDVLSKAGFIVTVRLTRGKDIEAACGQLAGKIKDRTSRSVKYLKSIQVG